MSSEIFKQCGNELANRNLTIALAESATAGRLSYEFALLPQSGKILKGGIVCYDAEVKKTVLHISQDLVDQFTPESAEVTRELATKISEVIPSDIQIGITGLTTPGGSENCNKPVGTMFICIRINGRSIPSRNVFKGTPDEIISQTVDEVAKIILNELNVEIV